MKTKLVTLILVTVFLLPSCASMQYDTREGKLSLRDKENVVSGTPAYVGDQIKKYQKDISVSELWVKYKELLIAKKYEEAAILLSHIERAERANQHSSSPETKNYGNSEDPQSRMKRIAQGL